MADISKEVAVQLAQPEPPGDENIADAWISASDSDGIAYDGPSFERGYRLGRGEYDEYTGALVADAFKLGRNAGLEEAKKKCDAEVAEFHSSNESRNTAEYLAAAVESLKDNTP